MRNETVTISSLSQSSGEGIPTGVERLVARSFESIGRQPAKASSGATERDPCRDPLTHRSKLERVVPRDAVEETIATLPPRPWARIRGRAAVAGLAARRSSPNGLEPVLAERGEVDHQVDGVGEPCR